MSKMNLGKLKMGKLGKSGSVSKNVGHPGDPKKETFKSMGKNMKTKEINTFKGVGNKNSGDKKDE